MSLLSLLPPLLPLLLAVPAASAEGAAVALTPERLLEWQGECPPAQRDQMGTSGAGVGKRRKGRSWGGRGRPGLYGGPRLCRPEKALRVG